VSPGSLDGGGPGARIPAGRVSSGSTAYLRDPLDPSLLGVDLRDLRRRSEDRGYAVGQARARAELGAAVEAAGAMAARLEALVPQESTAVAQALSVLATAVARRIVGAELHLDPTILVRALESAVTTINGSPEARVLLHPDQLERVREAWEVAHGSAYLGKRWTFEADASLPPGGCVLRFEHGIVTVGLEAQIEEVERALADALPGLRPPRTTEARTDVS
jgi:flagellar biosynthesis/type III secretory pathway protein FliH